MDTEEFVEMVDAFLENWFCYNGDARGRFVLNFLRVLFYCIVMRICA